MTRRVVVSAPGKVILMGEHAAVYGRPAVVAALDLRTTVEIEAVDDGLELDLATLGHREATDWAAIDRYTEAYAERWRSFRRRPTRDAFARLADDDPARVVKLALGETRRALTRPPARGGARVRVTSAIPVGSGFGSSASVACAVAGALLAREGHLVAGREVDSLGSLSAVALEVERRQHGSPSGVDHQTVLRGGLLRLETGAESEPGAVASIDEVAAAPAALEALRVFDTGQPAQTTGEVVAGVRMFAERDRAAFAEILDAMAAATREFAAALGDGRKRPGRRHSIRVFERALERLGVVPRVVRKAIRQIEDRGGAAKISGAGALSGERAGALLVYWPPELAGAPEDVLPGYPCHRAAIGAPGLRIEEAT